MFRSAALGLALLAGASSGAAASFAPHDITVSIVDERGQRLAHYAYPGHVPHGDRRRYVRAEHGSRYGVRVRNNTPRRIAFVLAVDGRNTVSGERSELSASEPMMVLGPWQSHTVRGWRTDLGGVHRFYFTDQADSYAEAFGDRSALGVIAVAAFRERPTPPPVAIVPRPRVHDGAVGRMDDQVAESSADFAGGHADAAAPSPQASGEAPASAVPGADAPAASSGLRSHALDHSGKAVAEAGSPRAEHRRQSSAATGFGDRLDAPARYTRFRPAARPFARDFLKYEWPERLVALGIIERPATNRFWPETTGHFAPVPRRY